MKIIEQVLSDKLSGCCDDEDICIDDKPIWEALQTVEQRVTKMEHKMPNKDLNYPHYPGIAGPTDMKKGGVERNFLRHIIFNLINLNNWVEKCKLLLK